MTLFLVILFFGALACVALPEIFYDRRARRFGPRTTPPPARRMVVIRDPDLSQWITHDPAEHTE